VYELLRVAFAISLVVVPVSIYLLVCAPRQSDRDGADRVALILDSRRIRIAGLMVCGLGIILRWLFSAALSASGFGGVIFIPVFWLAETMLVLSPILLIYALALDARASRLGTVRIVALSAAGLLLVAGVFVAQDPASVLPVRTLPVGEYAASDVSLHEVNPSGDGVEVIVAIGEGLGRRRYRGQATDATIFDFDGQRSSLTQFVADSVAGNDSIYRSTSLVVGEAGLLTAVSQTF